MKRDYHVNVIDKEGNEFSTWGECSADGTGATKDRLKKWLTNTVTQSYSTHIVRVGMTTTLLLLMLAYRI